MKADFGWDDTERKGNKRKEKGKGKENVGKEHGKERERQGKSRRAYGCRKNLGNVFSRPIPLYFLHFWVCLAARQLTCFRFFGQKDAHEHAVPHSESAMNSCNADR